MRLTGSSELKDGALFAQINLAVLRGIVMHNSFDPGENKADRLKELWQKVARVALVAMKSDG